MKFLKNNAKVLLILCLFSGVLFISTGCGEKDEKEDKKDTTEVEKKDETKTDTTTTTTEDNKSEDKSTDNKSNVVKEEVNVNTDYSVWVANTTINTDKNQRSYKVIWGDTLWLISTAWEVPYQEIARYNHIPNPDLIYVDQIIYNPSFK